MRRRFQRDESGAAAVEFAMVAPLLAAVLIGLGTMGGLILAYNKMRQAVSSGGQYAMTVAPDNTTAVQTVVLSAWDDKPANAVVNVQQQCRCGTTVSVCTTNCADGDYPQKIITITASRNYSLFSGGSRAISVSQQVRTW